MEQATGVSNKHVELATELTMAWLGNPNTRVAADEVPTFLRRMHETVAGLSTDDISAPTAQQQTEYLPAVTIRKSLASKDHILSMIDGKPYKTLRRHLATHGLTPEQYRERYGLRPDYPMVAENYSESRRAMAKRIGLGRKSIEPVGEALAQPTPTEQPVSRKKTAKPQDQ